MATQIHGAGPSGQRSPGLNAAIAAYLAENGGGSGLYLIDNGDGTFTITDALPATTTTTTTAATTTTTTTPAATTTTTTTAGTTTTTTTAAAIVDTFNRADNAATLGTTDTGQTWSTVNATWGINGNRAYTSVGTSVRGHAWVEVGAADMAVEARMHMNTTGSHYPGLMARYVDPANYYGMAMGAAPVERRVSVRVADVETHLSGNLDFPNGSLYRLETSEEGGTGTRVNAYVDGVLVFTTLHTLAGRPMGTKASLFRFSSGALSWHDDFKAEAI